MKIHKPINRVSFYELINLFTRRSEHLFVLAKPFGNGSVQVYDIEKGLEVRFWNFYFNEGTELCNNSDKANEDTYYTLAFFLSIQGLQFSYGNRYLPQNAIWDTLFFTNTSQNQIEMAAGARGYCVGISFSKNWLEKNILGSGGCINPLKEMINSKGPLCIYESMSVREKRRVQQLMETACENALGSFAILSGVLLLLSDFFCRLKEKNLESTSLCLQDTILLKALSMDYQPPAR